MEDTSTALSKSVLWIDSDPGQSEPESEGTPAPQPDAADSENAEVKDVSPKEKTLDRWFLEQRGNKRLPKRLEIPNANN